MSQLWLACRFACACFEKVRRFVETISQRPDYRRKVEMPIRNMHGQNAIGLQVLSVGVKTLLGQQVNWHRIATECVYDEDVEVLPMSRVDLLLQNQAGVSK